MHRYTQEFVDSCAAGCASRVQIVTQGDVCDFTLTDDLTEFTAYVRVDSETSVSVLQQDLVDPEQGGFDGVDIRTTDYISQLKIVLTGCAEVIQQTTTLDDATPRQDGIQIPSVIKGAFLVVVLLLAISAALSYDDALILERAWQQSRSIGPLANTPSVGFIFQAALLRLRTITAG